MNWEDVVYLSLLFSIIGSGHLIRQIRNVQIKKSISSVIGLVILFLVSGYHCFHPIVVTLVNSLIVFFVKRNAHIISFAFCFIYLAMFRFVHLLGFSEIAHHHLNAIQMIHTLKMVGLAFEMRDTYLKRTNPKDAQSLEFEATKIDPSFADVFHYAFCHVGLLTGPYFKFRTYWDWLHQPYSRCAPVSQLLKTRLQVVPIYAIGFFIGNYIFPLEYVNTEIYSTSFLYRWWYMTPLFFNFRMRLYIAFVLSECCCIAAGLGLYPAASKPKPGEGPTDFEELIKSDKMDEAELQKQEYSIEAIHNIYEYGAEMVPTVRGGMKCWNMTVQYWLAVFVHKRVKKFRVAITMLTSAFWHGVYPGYYLCLLTVPFVLLAEESMDRALRRNATPQGQLIYDWICWVFKMQAFGYMGMGFYLLQIGNTLNFWSSLYFFGHVLVVVFFLLGKVISQIKRRPSSSVTIGQVPSATEQKKES